MNAERLAHDALLRQSAELIAVLLTRTIELHDDVDLRRGEIGGYVAIVTFIVFTPDFDVGTAGVQNCTTAICPIDEFVAEVRLKVAECGIASRGAISENYPLLCVLQISHCGYNHAP